MADPGLLLLTVALFVKHDSVHLALLCVVLALLTAQALSHAVLHSCVTAAAWPGVSMLYVTQFSCGTVCLLASPDVSEPQYHMGAVLERACFAEGSACWQGHRGSHDDV